MISEIPPFDDSFTKPSSIFTEGERKNKEKKETELTKTSTIWSLWITLYNYDFRGVSIIIQEAIDSLIKQKKISYDDTLSSTTLQKILTAIYRTNENPDPLQLFIASFRNKTNNPIEAALQYIERLQQKFSQTVR